MLLFTVPCNLERFFSKFVKTSLTSGLEVSLILEISLFKSFRAVKIFSYISENKKGYGIIQRRKYYRFF